MPYKSLEAANPAILGIKPPVTLAQANAIAKHADGLEGHKNSIKSPWGTATSAFKKSHIVKGGKWVKREAKEFAEAATIKKRAQRLMRDAEALLATKKLPAAVRKEIRDLRNALRKTWADLSDESDNEWEAGELDMEMMEAMKIDVDGEKVAFADLLERWRAGKEEEPVSEYYADAQGYAHKPVYVPTGTVVTFAGLQAAADTEVAITETRILTSQFQGLVGNVMYSADIPDNGKLAAIQALTDEFIVLVTEQMEDIGEGTATGEAAHEQESDATDGLVKLAESMGSIVQLGEVEATGDKIVPLNLDIAIIEPGWGNAEDMHYYPREMLETNSGIFIGAKMYESDHSDDKSTRTWVSTVKGIAGFTETGAPIGRVIVHDKGFAERLMALAEAELINKMECSILASGKAKEGKIDGKKANVVESITEVASVDWVTRAGAGGRALNIAESEQEATMPDKEEIGTEEKKELEEATDVTLAEGKGQPVPEPEPEPVAKQEPEQEETLSKAEVQEALDSTNLPDEAKAWLLEAEYADKGALAEAVGKATERVKAMTGSGEITGMGESDPLEQSKPLTEEEKLAEFNEVADRCGFARV